APAPTAKPPKLTGNCLSFRAGHPGEDFLEAASNSQDVELRLRVFPAEGCGALPGSFVIKQMADRADEGLGLIASDRPSCIRLLDDTKGEILAWRRQDDRTTST